MSRKIIIKRGCIKAIRLKNSTGKRLLKKADVLEVVDMDKTLDLWPDSLYPKRRLILNNFRSRAALILHKQAVIGHLDALFKKENFMPPGYSDLVG